MMEKVVIVLLLCVVIVSCKKEEVKVDLKDFCEGTQFKQIAEGMTQALAVHYRLGE